MDSGRKGMDVMIEARIERGECVCEKDVLATSRRVPIKKKDVKQCSDMRIRKKGKKTELQGIQSNFSTRDGWKPLKLLLLLMFF